MRRGAVLLAGGALLFCGCTLGKSWLASPGTCDTIKVRDAAFRKELGASNRNYCLTIETDLRGPIDRLTEEYEKLMADEGKSTMCSIAARAVHLLDGVHDPDLLAATLANINTHNWQMWNRNNGGVAMRGDLSTRGWEKLQRSNETITWLTHLTNGAVTELRDDVEVKVLIELYGEAIISTNYVRMNVGVTLRWADGTVIPIREGSESDFGELVKDAAVAHWAAQGVRADE